MMMVIARMFSSVNLGRYSAIGRSSQEVVSVVWVVLIFYEQSILMGIWAYVSPVVMIILYNRIEYLDAGRQVCFNPC